MTHKQAAFAAATENIIKNLEKEGWKDTSLKTPLPVPMPSSPLSRKAASFHGAAANPSRKPG